MWIILCTTLLALHAVDSYEVLFNDNLKMKLTLTQNSSVQLPTNIFATHLPINMSATVLENSTDVTYLYRWWRNDRPVTKFTEQCYYVTTFSDARPKFVGVEIKMAKSETDPLTNSTTVIILQDAVTNMMTMLNSSILAGEIMHAEVTCNGSPPFILAWSVIGPVNSPPTVCEELSHCRLSVAFNASLPGNYTLITNASNLVSTNSTQAEFAVSKNDLNNSPIPAGIPILCASIALAFFCLFFIAYKKDLLSETNVETASFSLPESRAFFFEKASRRFNAMKDGLRRAYHSIQERYEAMKTKESTTPVVYRMSSPASYGTLEDSLTNSVHFEC